MKELIAGLFSAGYQEARQRTMALLLMKILSEAEHRVTELLMPQMNVYTEWPPICWLTSVVRRH
ncbi:TPA: hypothetical protein QHR58_003241 [Enterobacter kobei]|nr:hypothetical protein [Enterobacter kobei]